MEKNVEKRVKFAKVLYTIIYIIRYGGQIMKITTKKIFGLLAVMLLIATVPLAAATQTDIEEDAIGKKRTFVSGFILFPPRPSVGGMYMSFFAISMRAGEIGGDYHVYRLQPLLVKADYDFHGIALPGFIFGWFEGPIGIAG